MQSNIVGRKDPRVVVSVAFGEPRGSDVTGQCTAIAAAHPTNRNTSRTLPQDLEHLGTTPPHVKMSSSQPSPPPPPPPKMNHITSINEPFPTPQSLSAATRTHAQSSFRISARKLPISKAGPIEDMEKRIGIPMPEMIFGDNAVWVTHAPTGWTLGFSAPEALDRVDKTGEKMLKVAYARDWESTREGTTRGIKEVVKPYDWSYSTEYEGTVERGSAPEDKALRPTDKKIPIELLKRRDPILFFDEVVLYESELDDNGISIYSAKLRVHEKRMLLLVRFFLRLDNVLVRIRDTRVYVDFETDEVIREYTSKEAPFDEVKRVCFVYTHLPSFVSTKLTILAGPADVGAPARRRHNQLTRPECARFSIKNGGATDGGN